MIEDMQVYMKNYYEKNKEKWKNKYNNTDKYKEYQKKYREEHKEDLSLKNKENRESKQGKFVYFIFDKSNKIKYIGSTNSMYFRFKWHEFDKEKYDKNSDTVLYLSFNNTISATDLVDIEQYFIELYKPYKNNNCSIYDTSIIDLLPENLEFNEYNPR